MRTKTRTNRRILSILAAVALISAGAVGLSAQTRKSSKDTLVLANRDDVGTLAPYADTSTQGGRVRMQIYETLFTMENDGSYAPCLATDWDWDDDLHFTIKLRKDVKFHNGKDFKADDVVF
ncbi:MAG: ABC transporter substrate-binding protein, partial [Spirochaetaceae bacterium]|nr:ABC transporter substrate-binding protein [Spirochaetaceae bacterium]